LERAKDGDDGSDARGEAARRRGGEAARPAAGAVGGMQGARCKEQGARSKVCVGTVARRQGRQIWVAPNRMEERSGCG
jgi:hypothetical protein